MQWTGFSCDCPRHFRSLAERSTYIDIAGEIKRIKLLTNDEERIVAIQKVISYWRRLDGVSQDHYKKF